MSETQQEISKLEQNAKELVNNLSELRNQVGSYKTVKDELEKTNLNLLSFIESTKNLTNESHQIIKSINEIGSGNIFKKLKFNLIILYTGFSIIILLLILLLIAK